MESPRCYHRYCINTQQPAVRVVFGVLMKQQNQTDTHRQGTDELLGYLAGLEKQMENLREGLAHSHRLSMLGTISAVIAHEFNNILTPIISYAQMALENPDDMVFMEKALRKNLNNAQRAAQIAGAMLDLARDEDQSTHIANVQQAITNALSCLAREPEKDGIKLQVICPENVYVKMHPVHLQQVLLNLILNARKAMLTTGGRLNIAVDADSNPISLTVSDTGPGIPDEIKDSLFDAFVTRPPSTASGDATKGTGLGLHLCKELVTQAGGQISLVQQANTTGAHFRIELQKTRPILAEQGGLKRAS